MDASADASGDASADGSGGEAAADAAHGDGHGGGDDMGDDDGAPRHEGGDLDAGADAPGSLCAVTGVTQCCPDGVACVGSRCATRCGECDACAGQFCCVPNNNGQPVNCSMLPTCL